GVQQLRGVEIEPLLSGQMQVRFDLEVHAFEEDGELRVYWMYNRYLFDGWRIRQMASHYERLLATMAANPEARLHQLDILSVQEQRLLLEEFNPAMGVVSDQTFAGLFEQQEKRTPNAVAVEFGDRRLTYAELNAAANRLAHYLIGLGVGPGTLVAIALERSPEMVVALLGIVKAGGAY